MEPIIAPIINSESSSIFGVANKNLGVTNTNSNDFMKIFEETMKTANEAENVSNITNENLLNNTLDDLHTVMIDAAKAELTLGLALQIRNKAIDAYNEIMRMQI